MDIPPRTLFERALLAVRAELERSKSEGDLYDQQRVIDELNDGSIEYAQAIAACSDAEDQIRKALGDVF